MSTTPQKAPAKKAPAKKAPAKAAPKPAAPAEPTPVTPEPAAPATVEPEAAPDESTEPNVSEESTESASDEQPSATADAPAPPADDIAPKAAPLDAPPIETPPPAPIEISHSVAAQAVHRALAVDELALFDHATGGPINPDEMFDHPSQHAHYVVSRVRIHERVNNGPNRADTIRLLIPRGAQLNLGEAAVLIAKIKQVNEAAGVSFDDTTDDDTGE